MICGVLCSYKFSVLRLSTCMQCIHSGFVPFILNVFFFTVSFVCGCLAYKTDPKLPNKKKPREERSIDEAGDSTFMKISSGKARLFLWT